MCLCGLPLCHIGQFVSSRQHYSSCSEFDLCVIAFSRSQVISCLWLDECGLLIRTGVSCVKYGCRLV